MPNLRTGKIARLPLEIRTQLNRRLQNGSSLPRLLPWLNALPEVKAVLKEYFHSRPILRQNLSQWVHGGYQDWLHLQSPQDLSHCLTEDTAAFTTTHPPLTDTLGHWIALRLSLRTRRINALYEKDPEAADQLLTRMIRDLTTLQQSQTRVRREQRQRDQLTFQQDQAREKAAQTREKTIAAHEAWALHPDNHDHLDALWKKAYPEDYFHDEEDTDEESDASHQDEAPAPGHPERSVGGQAGAAQSKDPVPSSPNPRKDPAPAPITPMSPMSPTPRPEPERIFDHTSGTYFDYPDDDDTDLDPTTNHPPSPSPAAGTKTSVTPSEVEGPHPSAPTSPSHPLTPSPRPLSPTDHSRIAVARTLWPRAFAKYGLDVFKHIPYPDPSDMGRPVHPSGSSR